MASVFDKVLILLGVREEPEEEEQKQVEVVSKQRETSRPVRRGNLISLDGGGGAKPIRIIVIEPVEFEEVRTYVDHLKNKNPLIVRLTHMDVHEARRIVDFMSGATYAIDGNMRKLGDMIFFFAPQSVTIEGEIEPDLFDLGDLNEEL